jgi:signal transduction histidine kinase
MGPSAQSRTLVGIAAVAALYACVAKLGLGLDAVSGFATLVWPPTGLALAALLLGGPRMWPGVFVGAWIANVWTGAPPAVAVGIAMGNTLEAVLGAWAMRRLGDYRGSFDGVRPALALILGAAVASSLVSATIGVGSLALGGIVGSAQQALVTWRAWWLGDALGDLVVAALVLAWATRVDRRRPSAARAIEASVMAALLVLASVAVFFRPGSAGWPSESPYILFPVFVWAGLRFGLRGATFATALVSALAIGGTVRGFGPFARDDLTSSLLALQAFMGCSAITPLVVGGVTMDLARAVRARETFVTTVSHDLKNPINALLVSGDLLARTLQEEPVRKHHALLRRSVDRMMHLITDVLDASAIEAGRLSLTPRPEDSRTLVHDALDLLRPLAAAKDLTVRTDRADSIGVSCDRERVLRVLSNVIGNAIKFCPERCTITIDVERLDHSVCFSVRDSGPGIAAADLPHVFDRHWHADASAGGGSGLGLFIAKGIVEAHGGRIWVDSKPGAGSTFCFTLPAVDERPRRSLPHAFRPHPHT